MVDLQRLTVLLTDPNYDTKAKDAKENRTCVLCERSSKEFSSEQVRKSWDIMALCENCQDDYYIHNPFG